MKRKKGATFEFTGLRGFSGRSGALQDSPPRAIRFAIKGGKVNSSDFSATDLTETRVPLACWEIPPVVWRLTNGEIQQFFFRAIARNTKADNSR